MKCHVVFQFLLFLLWCWFCSYSTEKNIPWSCLVSSVFVISSCFCCVACATRKRIVQETPQRLASYRWYLDSLDSWSDLVLWWDLILLVDLEPQYMLYVFRFIVPLCNRRKWLRSLYFSLYVFHVLNLNVKTNHMIDCPLNHMIDLSPQFIYCDHCKIIGLQSYVGFFRGKFGSSTTTRQGTFFWLFQSPMVFMLSLQR